MESPENELGEVKIYTQNRKESLELEWCIENPSTLRENVQSPVFSLKSGFLKFKATLKIKPALTLNLTLCEGKVPVQVQHDVSLQADERSCKIKSFLFVYSLKDHTSSISLKISSDCPRAATKFESNFWQSSLLTITCIMTLSGHCINSSFESPPFVSVSESEKGLVCDLGKLFVKGLKADVLIRIRNKTILAHKLVLCARSSVFARMFECNMRESATRTIEITDAEFSTFYNFVNYLYTDEISDASFETCYALYPIADKYAVFSLKQLCAHVLKSSLTNDNVRRVLMLADRHQDTELKGSALGIYRHNHR